MKRTLNLAGLIMTCLMAVNGYSQSEKDLIQNYFNDHQMDLGLSKSDIDDWIIYNQHASEKLGIEYLYVQQRYEGIEVYKAVVNFVAKDNKVFMAGNNLQQNISDRVTSISPTISELEAIQFASEHFNIKYKAPDLIERVSDKKSIFEGGEISRENIPVRLMLYPNHSGEIKVVWDLYIYFENKEHWWSVRVDAVTGEIVDQVDWVVSCSFENCHESHEFKKDVTTGSIEICSDNESSSLMPAPPPTTDQYNVFAIPIESPNHGGRSLVVGPFDATASPYGWHDTDGSAGPEFTGPRGNNVRAQEDVDDNNGTGYAPDGGASLDFDFPLNLNQDPAMYQDPAITNLFYMNNIMHDIWYQYGFDEASGNFQENNYGNGGNASDFVNADAQDGGGINNANFATPVDGVNPRMQMYLWEPNIVDLLTVNSPANVAGPYGAIEANFGPPVPGTPITADFVIFDDGVGPDLNDACDPAINNIANKIAVIRRGDCFFTDKVLEAEIGGALAVIMVNNVGGTPITMGGTDPGLGIPAVMVSQADGEMLIAEIESGSTLNGTLVNPGFFAVDGDFDNGIISHEYGHGISTRLTGGASNSDCLSNAEQMGEGWSDWFGLMLTIENGDQATDNRGIGTYVTGEATDGIGIRNAPYTTDWAVNPYTYDSTNYDTYGNGNYGVSEPHGIGFVWATMLWDLNWALIDQYGYDSDLYYGTGGNNIAMNLVTNALKLQSCDPGFVDGRDAILLADQVIYGGANQCLIWNVFAARGLGYSADQGSPFSRTDQVEAFDLPPSIGNTFGSESASSCDSYVWATDGNTYTSTGAYTATVPNSIGCDSIITLNLTINSATSGSEAVNQCMSYTWSADGNTYTSSGNYTATLTNAAGCDSVATLNLTIGAPTNTTETVTACASYTWPADGNTYTATGTYMTTLTASTGCDSIITLDLTMSTSAATSETVEMCDSYTWATNGTTYTSSGSFTETLTSSTGCDSIVTLNLTINGSSTNAPEVVSACDSYTWAEDGNTYTSSGNYTLGLTTINGCDSTLTLDLTISNSYSNTEVVTACNSYTWAGDGNTYTASGNYNVVLTNAQGCDSSLTLDLTIENIDNGITYQDSVTLAATENGASYVWLDCNDNYSIVQGANGQNFAPLANGSYAVEVTLNGCVDTSDCMTISKVEIIESDFGTYLNLYPNPTFGDLTIDLGKQYAEVKLSVTDAAGRLIQELSILNSSQIAMKLTGEPGVYFLSLESSEGSQVTLRVVKE